MYVYIVYVGVISILRNHKLVLKRYTNDIKIHVVKNNILIVRL